MRRLVTCVTLALALGLAIFGCRGGARAGKESAGTVPERSLYDRLGGEPAIKAVVDQFVANVAADGRINKHFANANLDHLKTQLVSQLGQASGGPQQYTGRDMKTVHAGMGIDPPAFDALIEDLVAALDQFKVGEKEKGEILAILQPMKADIVEK
ncbi:MAG: group 1 truncated hemoglobin [Candidatus Eisenbacteria bacterium]|uniref:Group 1 truncated hemoglobin n=1 Tax=Eiseniibacteriota bacterium TaxID=2212470 RepID=A0A538S8K7_UNCEI|nr:MAG: group 1 truncated hemoglobin [Candidatus Eisenbacteria bacterium]